MIPDHILRRAEQKASEIKRKAASGEDIPYHLHFYTCRHNGKLRVFDVFDTIPGISNICETLVGEMQPIAALVNHAVDTGVYRHVNYGGSWRDADGAMRAFAGHYGLTDVKKLMETNSLRSVPGAMTRVIQALMDDGWAFKNIS